MRLIVLGSNSLGNCYILENKKEALIIEAGVPFQEVKKAMNYDIGKIVGGVVSHEHNDHAGHYMEFLGFGFPVLSPEAVYNHKGSTVMPPWARIVQANEGYKIGNFKIIPFELKHDVPSFGHQIDHPDVGRIVFLTDTFFCEYTFDHVTTWLIEANYADDILDRNIAGGNAPSSMRPRLLNSHMELETTKGILRSNDLSDTSNIVLIHLSDGNSDERRFIREITELTGKQVYAANKGRSIDVGLVPY